MSLFFWSEGVKWRKEERRSSNEPKSPSRFCRPKQKRAPHTNGGEGALQSLTSHLTEAPSELRDGLPSGLDC